MLKKILSFVLALMLCISLAACGGTSSGEDIPSGSTPEEPTEDVTENEVPEELTETKEPAVPSYYVPELCETDTLTWDFDTKTGTLSIHGEGPMRDYSAEAPQWETHNNDIRAVTLDDGITSVGAYAFFNYAHLTEVYLPDSVAVIGDSAFDYDWELRTITIPTSLRYVGSRAFYNTLIWEPKDLVFPEGCEYIGDQAFHSALKSGGRVVLPSTLCYLGKQAFTNAYFLSDFIVAENNPFFLSENHAIYTKDKKELRMVAPDGNYSGEFSVPDGVEKISAECFNVIHGIQTVTIPSSVAEIEEGAFFSTFDLKEILVAGDNPNYQSKDGILLSRDGTLLLAWPDGIKTENFVIPDGVERIGAHLFYGRLEGSYSVVLPEGVKEIGTMSLPAVISSLTLPKSLEKIDANVFYGGISLGTISYDGTKADWEAITVEGGNDALKSARLITK